MIRYSVLAMIIWTIVWWRSTTLQYRSGSDYKPDKSTSIVKNIKSLFNILVIDLRTNTKIPFRAGPATGRFVGL